MPRLDKGAQINDLLSGMAVSKPVPDSADWWREVAQGLGVTVGSLRTQRELLVLALQSLFADANRLCDRGLGGTYEEDCRVSLRAAQRVLDSIGETTLKP